MKDFAALFKKQTMRLEELDIHANLFNSDGFCTLLTCLRTFNKVRSVNVSHCNIANDLRNFKVISKFLNTNKVLEHLNLANCDIGE
jgi:Ran GTPase-activating protein (RanGAP) involved in mRNA processing and transport